MGTVDSPDVALVISDDGKAVLKGISSTLEKAGFAVLAASGSAAALHECRESRGRRVSVAVIDTSLTGISMSEVLRQLNEIAPDSRILFLGDESDTEEARGHARRYLRKPYRRSQFLGQVLELMDQPLARTA